MTDWTHERKSRLFVEIPQHKCHFCGSSPGVLDLRFINNKELCVNLGLNPTMNDPIDPPDGRYICHLCIRGAVKAWVEDSYVSKD